MTEMEHKEELKWWEEELQWGGLTGNGNFDLSSGTFIGPHARAHGPLWPETIQTINPRLLSKDTANAKPEPLFTVQVDLVKPVKYLFSFNHLLADPALHPCGDSRLYAAYLDMNELSPSQQSKMTTMTSDATPERQPEADPDVEMVETAPAVIANSPKPNDDGNSDLPPVAEPQDGTGNARPGSAERETDQPVEDSEMGGLTEHVANTVEDVEMAEGNEFNERGAQMQDAIPEPAIAEPDTARLEADLAALAANPDILNHMVQNGAFIPELMPDLHMGYAHGQSLQPAQDASLALNGQLPLGDDFMYAGDMGQMLPMGMPTLFENTLQTALDSDFAQQVGPEDTKVQGFARIDFDDGKYYLNSYNLIIGRDLQLHKALAKRDAFEQHNPTSRPPKSIVSEKAGFIRDLEEDEEFHQGHDRKRRKRHHGDSNKQSRRMKKSRSSDSSANHRSRRQSMAPPLEQPLYSDSEQPAKVDLDKLQPSPHTTVTLYIHPPYPASPSDWKAISREHLLIAYNFEEHLWEGIVKGRNGCFVEDELKKEGETFPLTNGCHLQIGAVELVFRLPEHIPVGMTGAERGHSSDEEDVSTAAGIPGGDETLNYVMSGKEMSLDFVNERRHALGLDEDSDSDDYDEPTMDHDDIDQDDEASDDEDEALRDEQPLIFSDEESDEEGEEAEDEDETDDQQRYKPEYDFEHLRPSIEPISQPQTPEPKESKEPKKRKVGRPPKDGISKRQQREEKAARLAQEASQKENKKSKKENKTPKEPKEPKAPKGGKESKAANQGVKAEGEGSQAHAETGNKTAPEGGEKRKVGRPRKHPRPDTPPEPREKRKYTKRKPKEPKEGEAKADGEEGDDENQEGKLTQVPRSPRSPTPTFNEEDLTPEQLQKPSCNYVVLIQEALSEAERKALTLPQIYRAIQRKYPYFVLRVATVGWQSSVRHNLGQNEGFHKVERDGKGWKWAIKPGATFDKEKKRKASPPPQYPPGYQQPIYPGVPPGYQMQGYPPGMMAPPHGYYPPPHHQMPPNYRPNQPYMGPPPMGHQPHMNGMYQPGPQQPMHHQPPLNIPPALVAPANASYSSPYAPKPPASTAPATGQASTAAAQSGPSASQAPSSTGQVAASTNQNTSSTGQPGPSTNQSGPSTNPSGPSTNQSGPSLNQPGPSTSQAAPSTSQSGPQPAHSAAQPGTSNPQSNGQRQQPGPPTAQSAAPNQAPSSNGHPGPSASQPGYATNQRPQGSGPPNMPVPQAGYQYPRQPQYPQYSQTTHFAQSFPPPQPQMQTQPRQTQATPQPYKPQQSQPQQPASQSQPQTAQQANPSTAPVINEKVMTAIESFRKALAVQMASKPNGLAILDGAVRTVLGQPRDGTPSFSEEAPIVEVLRNMLKKIGLSPQDGTSTSSLNDQRSPPAVTQPQPPSYQQANHSGTQARASQPPPPANTTASGQQSNAAIMRPSFSQNQNRQSGASVPRPQMNNMGRSNSQSSNAPTLQQTPLGSPAPPANVSNGTPSNGPPSNGASTPLPTSETGQGEGLKKEAVADDSVQVKNEPAGPSPPRSETPVTKT